MVKCEICNKSFLRINTFHLRKHGIQSESEYLKKYPNAVIMSDDCKKKISTTTIEGMQNMNDEQRQKHRWVRTDEYKAKRSIITKETHIRGDFKSVYTTDRNKKISQKKKDWWDSIGHKVMEGKLFGDYIGSEKHITMCKSNQIKATTAAMNVKKSKAEEEFELKLKESGKKYISQYFVEGYPFDFYLPDENTLIEIDGEFFHPTKLEDCKYPMQFHNFERDIKKTKIAEKNGFILKRIRV